MCNCGGSAVPRDEYAVTHPTNYSNQVTPGIAYRLLRANGQFEDFPTEAAAHAAREREAGSVSVFPVQKQAADA